MPGIIEVTVGDAIVSLEYARRKGDNGRTRYRWFVELPDGSMYTADDLQSGCQGGDLRDGFIALWGFLGAFADACHYGDGKGENSELFPAELKEWAMLVSSEFYSLEIELEEMKNDETH